MSQRRKKSIRDRREVGALGELRARRYLKRSGLKVLERNWRCRLGEIDIVARDGRELVFVEVKTRVAAPQQNPYLFDNITAKKQSTLRRLAECYLNRHFPGRLQPPFRIDVIGVLLAEGSYDVLALDHILRAI